MILSVLGGFMEISVIIISTISIVLALFNLVLLSRLKSYDKIMSKNFGNNKWGDNYMDSQAEFLIREEIDSFLLKNKASLEKDQKNKVEEYVNSSEVIDRLLTEKVEYEMTKEAIHQGSAAFVKENLPKILSKIDLSSVSNALVLKMTGQIMQNTSNQVTYNEYNNNERGY
jgi:hypothetical protein